MITRKISTPRGEFGVRVHGGSGEWVVCVHGFPDDASTFDALAAELARNGFRVAAIFLQGYHPSPLTGSLSLPDLVADLLAVIDALSPEAPVSLIGHDYGAQLAYPAMAAAAGGRFRRAVLLSGAHPAFVQRNARRSLWQLWRSRYIIAFQWAGPADRRVAKDDFAYVETLWRRWSPRLQMTPAHVAAVKHTFRASMPAPVAMYRAGGFAVAEESVAVPTLLIQGSDDRCAAPFHADGQGDLFTAGYEQQTWPDTGHHPHLEHPARTAAAVIGWLQVN